MAKKTLLGRVADWFATKPPDNTSRVVFVSQEQHGLPPDWLEENRAKNEQAHRERMADYKYQDESIPIPLRLMDVDSRIKRGDSDIPVTTELVAWELDERKWSHHYQEDPSAYAPTIIDHWPDVPEEQKLVELLTYTSVASLPARQGRAYLASEVEFAEIAEDRQRAIMGENWPRIGPVPPHSQALDLESLKTRMLGQLTDLSEQVFRGFDHSRCGRELGDWTRDRDWYEVDDGTELRDWGELSKHGVLAVIANHVDLDGVTPLDRLQMIDNAWRMADEPSRWLERVGDTPTAERARDLAGRWDYELGQHPRWGFAKQIIADLKAIGRLEARPPQIGHQYSLDETRPLKLIDAIEPPETRIRPLQRVRADSPEINTQKPLTM